jgi:hypothetical protein
MIIKNGTLQNKATGRFPHGAAWLMEGTCIPLSLLDKEW